MATPVVQYSSPDPSLSQQANFGQFVQYLITGTNYILDNKAQLLYEFNPANLGVITATGAAGGASYTQFLAYLSANPVTSVLPNPNGPTGSPATFGIPYTQSQVPTQPSTATPIQTVYDPRLLELLENILLEVRGTRMAVVKLALEGGQAVETDFDPTRDYAYSGADNGSFA